MAVSGQVTPYEHDHPIPVLDSPEIVWKFAFVDLSTPEEAPPSPMSVVAGPSPPRSTPPAAKPVRAGWSQSSRRDHHQHLWQMRLNARGQVQTLSRARLRTISPHVSQWTETWPSLSALRSVESSHWHKPGVLVRSQVNVSGAGKASSFLRCIEIAICEIRVCSKCAGNSFVHFTHADLSPRI